MMQRGSNLSWPPEATPRAETRDACILLVDPRRAGPDLGIVIPTLDEADYLSDLLGDLARLGLEHTVLVVDGGSRDGTVAAARAAGAWVMRSRQGRARQMNAGARLLRARWLLFLHADSRLGDAALRAVEVHVHEDRPEAGHFGLLIAHSHVHYRIIECVQRMRERLLGLVYGDQGLLIRRDLFQEVGPYPDEPIMEDVILTRWLGGGGRRVRLPAAVPTSPRRYEEEGRRRAWLRNAGLMSRFLAGTKPVHLAARYPARRFGGRNGEDAMPGAEVADATLLVFAKAPRPGKVKTRLARSLGGSGPPDHEAAAALYRRMGRRVVDNVAEAPSVLTVCYDPPDGEGEMREWLGSAPQRYWPQGGGDLGERMSRMFARAFENANRVVVIGTDTPTVGAGTVARALAALDTADVVLGPSRDGGYYLMALREPCPALFRGIVWSTRTVLAESVVRARERGLGVTLLEVETDVDTAADLTGEMAEWLGVG